jgi:hypothetical protein
MKIQRTLPPAASPILLEDIISGFKGIVSGRTVFRQLKMDLKKHFKVNNYFFLSSGKAALTIILRSMHHKSPDKSYVIIPAYTCYSVPSAIMKAGLNIKLCDISPESFDFDYDHLEKLCSDPGILAVVPTHLFGIPTDIDCIKRICRKRNIYIVEDAAQAMGGAINEYKLGTLGDAGFFSLGRGKAFSTVEGGIILTDNSDLAGIIKQLIIEIPGYSVFEVIKIIGYSMILNIFLRPEFFWIPKNLPFLKLGETFFEPEFKIQRMSFFQAGLARNWYDRLKRSEIIRKRCVNE